MRYKDTIGRILLVASFCILSVTNVYAACDNSFVGDFKPVCDYASGQGKTDCQTCADKCGVWTGLGCIVATPQGIFETVFPIFIGIAGGIAFLLILFGGFQIMVSAGNPEQLNAGRELITSAIAGLLLIIFSVFLLRLIGYDILRIPGFG